MRYKSQQAVSDEALASHCRAESEFPEGDKVRDEWMAEATEVNITLAELVMDKLVEDGRDVAEEMKQAREELEDE